MLHKKKKYFSWNVITILNQPSTRTPQKKKKKKEKNLKIYSIKCLRGRPDISNFSPACYEVKAESAVKGRLGQGENYRQAGGEGGGLR